MFTVIGALSSCALIREDSAPRPMIAPERIDLAKDIRLARDGWPAARWWTRYDDAQLNALIERGLADSPGMRVARERVEQARADVRRARAATRLKAAAFGRVYRQWSDADGRVGPFSITDPVPGLDDGGYNSGARDGTVSSAGIAGSYALDLWGLQRSAVEATVGAQNAQLAEAAAAELEIATGVAQTYFSLQTTLAKIALLERMRDIQAESVAAMKARRERGLVAQSAVAKPTEQLLQAEQLLSLARTQLIGFREVLRALVGAGAEDFAAIEAVPLPQPQPELPATLSYALLSHRPDLVVLRWYVESSFDQVDAARAAFYPSFDIKALLGFNAIRIDDVLHIDSRQFRLVPGLTLPLFDGGQLNANLRKARTTSNTLIEQYNQAVLNAVRDVAVAAAQVQGLEEQARLEQAKYRQVRIGGDDADARRARGLLSRVAALEAQIPALHEEAQLADTQGKRLAAEISLIKALGGGYDLPELPRDDPAERRRP
ncbi:MAG TPA: efflux transporter outer membrane subunit [Dokdonella sp.]|uniref:efflux transporter outer membrane subunit n=1 Tax=Dokdonella sp. TaxID=2291710 RepID=UPI002C84C25D|nr:efflux transporter outer membrane subunit [Dokdonella sp.]HUD43462.1 efflux transporter outer membrane subunit [Dokdonella sp.]